MTEKDIKEICKTIKYLTKRMLGSFYTQSEFILIQETIRGLVDKIPIDTENKLKDKI